MASSNFFIEDFLLATKQLDVAVPPRRMRWGRGAAEVLKSTSCRLVPG